MAMDQPFQVEESSLGLHVALGQLQLTQRPGVYNLCWCPASVARVMQLSPLNFRAPAGRLSIHCPAGTFYSEVSEICANCGKKFYCAGGSKDAAVRTSCGVGRAALHSNAASPQECQCMRGYQRSEGECFLCEVGKYKATPGDADDCIPCPDNQTTFLPGSVSISSCFEPAAKNASAASIAAPAVIFNLSIALEVGGGLDQEVLDEVRQELSLTLGIDADIVSLKPAIPFDPNVRRLFSEQTLTATVRFRTMEEANEFGEELGLQRAAIEDSVSRALAHLRPNVKISELDPLISSVTVTCPETTIAPPGVQILREEDCVCVAGYGRDPDGDCTICSPGEYKANDDDSNCLPCAGGRTTLLPGMTSSEFCQCAEGFYAPEPSLPCEECGLGFYCNGTGDRSRCPENSVTWTAKATNYTDCQCEEGFQGSPTGCQPCPRGLYKAIQGNGACPQSCPANADSEPGASSLKDCKCDPGFHAQVDESDLSFCTRCTYDGLSCPGGFAPNSTEHVQPEANEGFFRTSTTTAVKCRVLMLNGSSACRGGNNACAPGSMGQLCGECPWHWARSETFRPCEECPGQAITFQLTTAILMDLGRIRSVNFVIAALAAMAAAKGTRYDSKLHTTMFRIVSQWWTACAIITQFNLETLEPFSGGTADMTGQRCSGEPNEPYQDSPAVLIASSPSRLAWPPFVSVAMEVFFEIMAVVPNLQIQFVSQCQAEQLFPTGVGSLSAEDAKRLASALRLSCD